MKRISFLILLAVSSSFIGAEGGCKMPGLSNADVAVNKQSHVTQLVVSLTGQYASTESAEISVSGIGVIGTASGGGSVSKEVEPGTYTVSARSLIDNEQVWTNASITVIEGQTGNVTFSCSQSYIDVFFATKCEEKYKVLHVQVADGSGGHQTLTMYPGNTHKFGVKNGKSVVVVKENNYNGKTVLIDNTRFLLYGQTYNISTDCD